MKPLDKTLLLNMKIKLLSRASLVIISIINRIFAFRVLDSGSTVPNATYFVPYDKVNIFAEMLPFPSKSKLFQ